MAKGLLFACLVVMLHQQVRAMEFRYGLNLTDLIEWKAEVAHIRRPSLLFITFPISRTTAYTVMKMQIQGARFKLVFSAGVRGKEVMQRVCSPKNNAIVPRKPFRFIFRFTSKSIMVYLNGDWIYTQPFEIPNSYIHASLGRIASIRVYHMQASNGVPQVLRLLTDEMLGQEMQEVGCGTITRDRGIPPFCEKLTRAPNTFRIVGGVPARPGQNSWQVAIRKKPQYSNVRSNPHVCGATLVGSCWVISAAHCFLSTSPTSLRRLVVRVGDYYNQDGSVHSAIQEFELSKDVEIANVFVHPKYASFPESRNDIAVVRLAECVNYNRFVKPACLPYSSTQFPERTSCGISGWGAANETEHNTEYPRCLQTAQVSIKTNRRCKRAYGSSFDERIMMCAGKSNVDACLGDSGGPLICSQSNAGFTLWGITSWGIGCGDISHPGVYTRLVTYIRWIYTIMKLHPDDGVLADYTTHTNQPHLPNSCGL